jgi:hypothetical protein
MSIKGERSDLEKMIAGSSSAIDGPVVPAGNNPELKMEPAFTMNFDLTKKNCHRRARRMINNATGLMLSDEMVSGNPYLKNKMQVDIISLSGLLYQLEINEMMQEALMEEVRSGAAHPRMFEVFGNLSKTIGDLNKQLLQTVEAIKMTYRDVKSDIREKAEELKAIGPHESGVMRNKDGIVAMGTKELINEAKKLKIAQNEARQNIIDIEEAQEIKEQ